MDVPGTSADSLGLRSSSPTPTRARSSCCTAASSSTSGTRRTASARDTKLASWSVAKSMVSLLTDQAIHEGRLKFDTKLVDVIPVAAGDLAARRRRGVQPGHRARPARHDQRHRVARGLHAARRPGRRCRTTRSCWSPASPAPTRCSSRPTCRASRASHRTMLFEPGTQGEYISLNSQLLGMVLEATYGKDLVTLFRTRLWEQAGAQFPATWNLDRDGGTPKGFCCLNAAGRDFARLGQLVLDAGTPRRRSRGRGRSGCSPRASIRLYGGEWPYSTNFWHIPADLPQRPLAPRRRERDRHLRPVHLRQRPHRHRDRQAQRLRHRAGRGADLPGDAAHRRLVPRRAADRVAEGQGPPSAYAAGSRP